MKREDLIMHYYPIVENVMETYDMKETDIPDWHGAFAQGIIEAADRSLSCDPNACKVDHIYSSMIYRASFERPACKVIGRLSCFMEDISDDDFRFLLFLCEEYGTDGEVLDTILNKY